MMTFLTRIRLFFRSIWNGVLGIFTEIMLTLAFIAVGFLVCLIWWRMFR